MKKQDYTASILVKTTPAKAFKAINDVAGWWTEKLKDSTENLNDVFTVDWGESFVTIKIVESIPGKKVVWTVTDCHLTWFTDKKEWKDTQMVFEIAAQGDSTSIQFTHVGIQPQVECYEVCSKGWDQYIKTSLPKLITEGVGLPQKKELATA